jgi:hypothetical protein
LNSARFARHEPAVRPHPRTSAFPRGIFVEEKAADDDRDVCGMNCYAVSTRRRNDLS